MNMMPAQNYRSVNILIDPDISLHYSLKEKLLMWSQVEADVNKMETDVCFKFEKTKED